MSPELLLLLVFCAFTLPLFVLHDDLRHWLGCRGAAHY
jgi:hypothetical protein